MKFLQCFLISICLFGLFGCGRTHEAEPTSTIELQETDRTISRVERASKKREEKPHGHGGIVFLCIVSLLLSGYSLISVNQAKKQASKKRESHHYPKSDIHHEDEMMKKIMDIERQMNEQDQNIVEWVREKFRKKEEDIKNYIRQCTIESASHSKVGFFTKSTDPYTLKNETNSAQFPTASPTFSTKPPRDDVEEYNMYINTGNLPAHFTEMHYTAQNGKLVEDIRSNISVFIVENHVFPGKSISNSMVQMRLNDAFHIIGTGKTIHMTMPCTVNKLNNDYEIIEKGQIELS